MSENTKKAPYVVAVIQKDAVEHLPKVVHAFEVPVLQQVHGAEKVFIDEGADLPNGMVEASFDPEEEFTRLEQLYGADPETKQSYVTQAYGGRRSFLEAVNESARGEESLEAARKINTSSAKGVTGYSEANRPADSFQPDSLEGQEQQAAAKAAEVEAGKGKAGGKKTG